MNYPEFDKYTLLVDEENHLINLYRTDDGHLFYVEPGFYDGLLGLLDKKKDDRERILNKIDEIVKKNEKVVFTGNYEAPYIDKEGYIYREITDITDPLQIFVEDKSRGSDYGD